MQQAIQELGNKISSFVNPGPIDKLQLKLEALRKEASAIRTLDASVKSPEPQLTQEEKGINTDALSTRLTNFYAEIGQLNKLLEQPLVNAGIEQQQLETTDEQLSELKNTLNNLQTDSKVTKENVDKIEQTQEQIAEIQVKEATMPENTKAQTAIELINKFLNEGDTVYVLNLIKTKNIGQTQNIGGKRRSKKQSSKKKHSTKKKHSNKKKLDRKKKSHRR
jgi:hypothetical protein